MGLVLWVVAAWIFVAVVGAWIWSRAVVGHEEPSNAVRGFVRELRAALDAHPDTRWVGLIPGRFAAVIAVDGQETPVSLHVLFREYQLARRRRRAVDAFGVDLLGPLVGMLIQEVREEGLEHVSDFAFAEIAGDLLPQVRTGAWLRANGAGGFGASGIVSRPIPGDADLHVCYVIDHGALMTFVCRQHLKNWQLTPSALHQLALQNLRGLGPLPRPDDPAWLSRTCDGYDAARVLLLDDSAFDGALVALPERDTLWIGRVPTSLLPRLVAISDRRCAAAQRPISPTVYRLGPEGVVSVVVGAEA
jgi:hypothetical protein